MLSWSKRLGVTKDLYPPHLHHPPPVFLFSSWTSCLYVKGILAPASLKAVSLNCSIPEGAAFLLALVPESSRRELWLTHFVTTTAIVGEAGGG